jgi:hypothetical protein
LKTGVEATTLPTQIFFKRKRKKRKPTLDVEGFKKASFSDKILPCLGVYSVQFLVFSCIVVMEMIGWRFYPKPERLELAFLNTWNIFLFSFFSYFF